MGTARVVPPAGRERRAVGGPLDDDARPGQLRRGQPRAAPQARGQVELLGLALLARAEGEVARQDAVEAIHFLGDEGGDLVRDAGVRQHALEMLAGAADDAQRIADLVRDAGGHAAHRREILLAHSRLAGALQRGHDALQCDAEHGQHRHDDTYRQPGRTAQPLERGEEVGVEGVGGAGTGGLEAHAHVRWPLGTGGAQGHQQAREIPHAPQHLP